MGSSKQGGWQANGQAPHAKGKKITPKLQLTNHSRDNKCKMFSSKLFLLKIGAPTP